jgi:hypothetical protein
MPSAPAPEVTREDLLHLVYELLDAHDDTARLAADLAEEPRWRIHLDYLRDLQRVARGTLAHATAASDATPEDLALGAAGAAVERAMTPRTLRVDPTLALHRRR